MLRASCSRWQWHGCSGSQELGGHPRTARGLAGQGPVSGTCALTFEQVSTQVHAEAAS